MMDSTRAGSPRVIRLHPEDDVIITLDQLIAGARVESEDLTVAGLIPPGHKITIRANRAIAQGQAVRRYSQVIGFTSRPIARGQHVHTDTHNLIVGDFARDHALAEETCQTPSPAAQVTFDGIVRPDGRVATRNYIGIPTSVNCSATVGRAIADRFSRDVHPEALACYPNVDGVVALTHDSGCAVDSEGESLAVL